MSATVAGAARAAPTLQRLWPAVALVAIIVVIALIASFAPPVLQRRTTQGLINLVAVVALYVFVGNSGVLSFGNVAFMAVGAYVSALLTMKPAAKSVFLPDLPAVIARAEWPVLPGALAGGLVAALIALVVGWPLMRLSGVSASIATFAILVVANVVFGNWTAVTGGQNSLMGLPAYVDLWTALAWAVAAIVIAFAYQETRSALLLRASREDQAAAQAVGVNVVLHRLIAFVISAFLSGISGVLLGHFLGIVRVENFYLDLTFLIVAMLIIGGRGSLTGAVAGAGVIAVLTELLRQMEIGFQVGKTTIAAPAGTGDVILALIMLLIILFRPDGIAAGRELSWPFARS
jgi:branched-chain amino acid transport system permease protein